MNRKKAILAIFMMAFLIIIGFVFPSIWKSPKGNKKSETENTQHDDSENTETEQAENNESISFQDFEALEDFFSKEQVKLFQEELTSYLKNVKQMSLTSIRFLADDTTYPNASDFQRGNGLISTNNNNITVEFKASNLEKELITTDRQELLEILKRQDKKVG